MTNATTASTFLKALKQRAEQAGGLDYAIGFLHSTFSELNLQGYDEQILKRDTANLHGLIDSHNATTDWLIEINNDRWVPACDGAEIPFMSCSGKRLLYVWQPATGQHAYLDLNSDIILSDEEAEACLALH